MNIGFLALPVLFPIVFGGLLPVLPFKSEKARNIYTELIVVLNTVFVWALFTNTPSGELTLFQLTKNLSISFEIDSMSKIFGGLISVLWPLATLYAFEYMEHEERKPMFFAFYTMTYGVTVGIAFAANLITMYMFYELLTLVTLPLVMHEMDEQSIKAGQTYMTYSIAGAAFAFIALIVILSMGTTLDFTFGGVLRPEAIEQHRNMIYVVYLFAFFGFGVKAAVFPFHGWLPKASVAPTPVTALLHAVAVVKAGVFAIARVTYYSFGADVIRGSFAQYIAMTFALITIVYASSMAVKETHIKRRLAYSTISNLSYVAFALTIMTPLGLEAGLSHIIAHGMMKFVLFLCAGGIMHHGHRTYVEELEGIGCKMKGLMICFLISSLGVMGIPPLIGFASKWNIALAATNSGQGLAYAGVGVLIFSAVLTAVYLLTIVVHAFVPSKEFSTETLSDVKKPRWTMMVPLIVVTGIVIVFGIYFTPIFHVIEMAAKGL
jgi:multicomponent Na+:H+ antiporter subunit D